MTTLSSLQSHLSLSTPIIQAPMAGASNDDFIVGACRLGVLGSLGAGIKRLLSATGNDTRLTQLYSGKWARGVMTK